jgi:hypothetical protein
MIKILKKSFSNWFGCICLLQFFFLAPAFAFRAEQVPAPSQVDKSAKQNPVQASPISPTQQQIAATDELRKLNVSVDWDSRVNSPTSVRGKGLGVKPLSGQSVAASVFVGTYGQRAIAVLQNLAPLYGIQNASSELQANGSEKTCLLYTSPSPRD